MKFNISKLVLTIITLTTAPFLVLLFDVNLSNYTPDQPVYWQLVSYGLAIVFGYIGSILLFWQFILGIRFISSIFSNNTLEFNKIHKFLGIYGVLFALLHPFLIMYSFGETLAFVLMPDLSNNPMAIGLGYGRIAFFLLLIIWISSAFLRNKIGFRTWKVIHFLAYPIMGFILSHA